MAHSSTDSQPSVASLAERFGSKRERTRDHQKEYRLSKADIGRPMPSSEKNDMADSSEDISAPSLMLKCVVIQKNEKGYGLTVSGDNPVYVQSVKDGGAAHTAGVRQGDKIVKVNGTSVTDFNHVEVVKLIKSGHHVALTLISQSPTLGEISSDVLDQGSSFGAVQSTPKVQPTLVIDNAFHDEKVNTIKKMLEQEKSEVERIKDEYAKNPNKKLLEDLAVAQKLLQDLEKQLWKVESSEKSQDVSAKKEEPPLVEMHTGISKTENVGDEQKGSGNAGLKTVQKPRDLTNVGNQRGIMNFDEDELALESDDHQSHGPFQEFENLKIRPAYTAVFLNYVFRSHDPSPLLFTLTAEQYRQITSTKELLKLSDIITKTYLVPNAPLKVDIDDGIAKSIVDNTIPSPRALSDDTLRVLFDPAVQHALKMVKSQLNEFCKKREQGLSNCFGEEKVSPTMEHVQEVRAVEDILAPLLQDLGQIQSGLDDSEILKTSAKLDALERLIVYWTGKKKSKLTTRIGSMLRPNKPTPLVRPKNASSVESIIDEQNKRKSVLGKLVPKKTKVKDSTTAAVIPVVPAGQQDSCCGDSSHVSGIASKFQDANTFSNGNQMNIEGIDGNLGFFKKMERSGSFRDRKSRSVTGKSISDPDLNDDEQALRGTLEQSDSLLSLSASNASLPSVGIPVSQASGSLYSGTSDDSIRQLIIAHPELEVEVETQWSSNTPRDLIKQLDKKECKRQEIINELLHTEKHHVRDLLILYLLFYQKMLTEGGLNQEELFTVFPNLYEILELHQRLRKALLGLKEKDGHVIKDIAATLLKMFDGSDGEKFKNQCAKYCGNQTAALEFIKERCRRDQKFNAFIQATERHPICRRLQLKDFIPGEFQRLTKYPLLLENIIKNTKNKDEAIRLKQAHKQCKDILQYVNKAVKDAEDYQKIVEIQKNLDSTSLNKANHPIAQEYKNINLTARKLVHQGPLTWRITQSEKKKSVELHCVLFEDIMVLLQKQEDRYVLKCHTSVVPLNSTKEEKSAVQPPILKLSKVLVRNVATDKKAFYVLSNSEFGAQIYELVATSVHEMQEWFKIVSSTAEIAKKKDTPPRRDGFIVPGTSRSIINDKQLCAMEAIKHHQVSESQLMDAADNMDKQSILKSICSKHEEIAAALVNKHNLLAMYAGIEAPQLDNILAMSLLDDCPDQSTIVLHLLSSCRHLTSFLNELLTPDTDFIQPNASDLLLPTMEVSCSKSSPSSEPSTPKPSTPTAAHSNEGRLSEDLCGDDIQPVEVTAKWGMPQVIGSIDPSLSLSQGRLNGNEVPQQQSNVSLEFPLSDYETASEPSSPTSADEVDSSKSGQQTAVDEELLISGKPVQNPETGGRKLSFSEQETGMTSPSDTGIMMSDAKGDDGNSLDTLSAVDNTEYSFATDKLVSPIAFDPTDLLDFGGHALCPPEVTVSSSPSALQHVTGLFTRANPVNLSKLLEIVVLWETQLTTLLQSVKDSELQRQNLLEQIAMLQGGQFEKNAEMEQMTPHAEENDAPEIANSTVIDQTTDEDTDSRR